MSEQNPQTPAQKAVLKSLDSDVSTPMELEERPAKRPRLEEPVDKQVAVATPEAASVTETDNGTPMELDTPDWDYERIRGMIATYIELRNKDKIDEVDNIVDLFAQSEDENVLDMLVEMIPATLELTCPVFKTEAGVRELWATAIGRTPRQVLDPENPLTYTRFMSEYNAAQSGTPPLGHELDYDIVRGMIAQYIELRDGGKLIRDQDKIRETPDIIGLFAESRDPQVLYMLATMIPASEASGVRLIWSERSEWQTEVGIHHIWSQKIAKIDERGDQEPQSDELYYQHRFLNEYWYKYWEDNVFVDPDRIIQDAFLVKYAKDFVVNTHFKKDSMKICYFHNDKQLWGMGKGYAMSIIKNYLRNREWKYWNDTWMAAIALMPDGTPTQKETKKTVQKLIKKLLQKFAGSGGWLQSIATTIHNNMLHESTAAAVSIKHREIQFNLARKTKQYFQFKNKAYNLKTGQLEDRTRDMYITASGILDYDYPEGETDADYQIEIDFLNKKMAQSQPDPKFQEALKRWRGYCLTGETKARKFIMNVGYTAENSKSFQSEVFCKCFPIYGQNMNKKALNKGNTTGFNKAFSSLANRPVRLIYFEEFADTVDVEQMKVVVDKSELAVCPLYQEQLNMQIQYKLEASANSDMNTGGKICKGLNRRGRLMKWNSQFVDDPDDVDEQNHKYLKDESLLDRFDDDRYKIALFRIFAPYAMKFYQEGLVLPNECKEQFAENLAENDEWAEWVDNTFKKTNCAHDIISKGELLGEARSLKHDADLKWAVVKCEFQKRGYKYDSQKQVTANKITTKGFITGITRVGSA
jgi:hypothetical protein